MTKSFKKFREEWSNEWGENDDDFQGKDRKLRERRENRRKKTSEKLSRFDDKDGE
jgi:hypothetical protein